MEAFLKLGCIAVLGASTFANLACTGSQKDKQEEESINDRISASVLSKLKAGMQRKEVETVLGNQFEILPGRITLLPEIPNDAPDIFWVRWVRDPREKTRECVVVVFQQDHLLVAMHDKEEFEGNNPAQYIRTTLTSQGIRKERVASWGSQ